MATHSIPGLETAMNNVTDNTQVNENIHAILMRLDQLERAMREIRQLVGPFGVPFPNDEILVQTLYGTKYFIDANDLVMTPQLVTYRQWESDLSSFFVKSITPDTVFLDVGANFGYFTCLVASNIGASGSGKVIAVEPNPRIYDMLSRNIRINWSMAPVETHACALTADGMSVDLMVPAHGAANASIVTEGMSHASGSNTLIHVRGNTLDRIVAGRRVDIIKIDVEGHELDVLNGASETFRAASNIHLIMEWALAQMIEAKINPSAVIDKFEELDLAYYYLPESIHVSNADTEPLRLSRQQLLSTPYANIYLKKLP